MVRLNRGLLQLLALAALLAVASACRPATPASVRVLAPDAIEFTATVNAAGFEQGGEMAGYHFIVWRGGRAAEHALLLAHVTDVQVLDALEALGARPGNALSIATWDKRDDPRAEEPAAVIAGPPVAIEIRLPGQRRPLRPEDLLEDEAGRGFDMRFGGHRDNIPKWHSGCVVCLYSCPGSKVGNAAYTVRDFVAHRTRFRVRPGVLPPDGTDVRVRLRLAQE